MIRKAKNSDSAQLAELFSQLHRHHCEIAPHKHRMPSYEFFERGIKEILEDEDQTVLVNLEESENKINAYAVLKLIEYNSEQKIYQKICFIDCFAVAEETRGKGVGSMLFNAVKEFGRERGCNAVQLGVDAENGGAIKFYKKMGLTPKSFILTEQI